MKRSYGPAERLEEQVELLLQQGDNACIVQLSFLGERVVDVLCRRLANAPQESEALVIVRALGIIANPTAVSALREFLERESGNSRLFRAATNALRKIGDSSSLEALRGSLGSFDPDHAAKTFQAFGETGQRTLLEAMGSEDEDVNRVATRAALIATPERAVPRLLQAVALEHAVGNWSRDKPNGLDEHIRLRFPEAAYPYIEAAAKNDSPVGAAARDLLWVLQNRWIA